MIKDEKRMIKD